MPKSVIVDYLIQNAVHFTIVDYIILIVWLVPVVLAAWQACEWAYRKTLEGQKEVIATQKDVISAQDKKIEIIKEHVEQVKAEKENLNQYFDLQRTALAALADSYAQQTVKAETAEKKIELLCLYLYEHHRAVVLSQFALTLLAALDNAADLVMWAYWHKLVPRGYARVKVAVARRLRDRVLRCRLEPRQLNGSLINTVEALRTLKVDSHETIILASDTIVADVGRRVDRKFAREAKAFAAKSEG